MTEQLNYYAHELDSRHSNGQDILTRPNEVHELAADIQRIGAVALLSNAQAALAVGGDHAPVRVPNPIVSFHEKRPIRSLWGKGKERQRRIRTSLETADDALNQLQTELDQQLPNADSQGVLQPLREPDVNANFEMLLDGAALSPFLRMTKQTGDELADASGVERSWESWFAHAPDEQLTNFAQWYTDRLRNLAEPETRTRYVESLKVGYAEKVNAAMDEGWISSRHKPKLDQRMASAEVRFFSPFGHMTKHLAGVAQKRRRSDLVLLPTITGPEIVTHELGHVFAAIDDKGMKRHFEEQLGKDEVASNMLVLRHLYAVLNEGSDEHMTAALLNGSPEIVSPTERLSLGIAEVPGSSDIYRDYREVLATLLGGDTGEITRDDMLLLTDSAVDGNFAQLAELINNKWHGRRVLNELVPLIAKHDRASWQHMDDPNYEKQLCRKIIRHLQVAEDGALTYRKGLFLRDPGLILGCRTAESP
jgi:hypothetical protein